MNEIQQSQPQIQINKLFTFFPFWNIIFFSGNKNPLHIFTHLPDIIITFHTRDGTNENDIHIFYNTFFYKYILISVKNKYILT